MCMLGVGVGGKGREGGGGRGRVDEEGRVGGRLSNVFYNVLLS